MGIIRRPLDSSSCGTESTALIEYVGGIETHILALWCLDLYGISRKFHPTARVEVTNGTVG